ncbi:hypothetical protein Pyn_04440 [Prunus yedoensis var. nudiflora]|uniref:Uncharacterized protein n=1 Tax=Prunus yedoensis var. nudiflora TaxID=2094558 RepID=A0A314YP72_PRUYE|nr:hypothetical protein Pyn_04440 [Prunus yedoensis var. nudiflora]
MKHISLAPSTKLANITISVGPFRSQALLDGHLHRAVQSTELTAFAISLMLPMATCSGFLAKSLQTCQE